MAGDAAERSVPTVDRGAYLRRIGYAGSDAPSLETLCKLHELHPRAIPFENLTTLLGDTPPLDVPSLERKMVHGRRGGYCFEQNRLFAAVLESIGFEVVALAARVLWERGDNAVGPRTHMLLAIGLSGRTYICDVGFGGLTLTAPLLLEAGEQTTPHETFRLRRRGRGWLLEAELEDEWRPLYWFDTGEYLPVDFDVLNHFVATHPMSPFPSQLYGARTLPDRRLGLRNNRFTIYHRDGSRERRDLETVAEIRAALSGDLAIELPDSAALDDALQRVIDVAARST